MTEFERMLVVGFDGLDYQKIKEYDCENLMLESFGKIDLEGLPLKTPLLWSSMITGVKPEEHGIDSMLKFKGEKVRRYDELLKKVLNRFGWSAIKLREAIMHYIFDSSISAPTKENMKVDSIFEKVADSKPLDIPGYSHYPYLAGKMNVNAVYKKHAPVPRERVVRDVKAEHLYRKKQLFENIGEHKLVMQHLHYPDWMQHLYPKEEKDEGLYNEMNELAGKILEKTDDDTLVVFCSDHGLEDGGHRDQAFYAMNTDIDEPVKITEILFKALEKVDYSKADEKVHEVEI
jgi:predicted AlkP superfamily phosphohydrolase/phosphomutase